MKKITLSALIVVCAFGTALSQLNYNIIAPPNNAANSAFRAPNGTQAHAYMRSIFYVHPYELLPMNLATINSMSFQILSGASTAVTGNFTVYLRNSDDMQYAAGNNFVTAFGLMQQVYTGQMTVPQGPGPSTVGLTFTQPFTFTGGGIYVGLDWENAGGPFAATSASYVCSNVFNTTYNTQAEVWCGTTNTSVTPVSATTTDGSNFRPSIIWGGVNTANNEIEVVNISAPGQVVSTSGPQNITARIVNSSIGAQNNVSVALNVTGANPHTDVIVIPTMAPGAIQTVTFTSYNPTMNGVSNMTIAAAAGFTPDDIPTNNFKYWTQRVDCQVLAVHPPNTTYTTSYGFSPTGGIFSSKVNLANPSSVQAVKVAIGSHTSNSGKSLYAVLLNSAGTILSSGNPVAISPSGTVTLPFTAPQSLNAGTDYFIGVAQPSASAQYYPFAYSPYLPFVAPIYYLNSLAAGAAPAARTTFGLLGIEPVLASTAPPITITAVPQMVCKGESATLTATGPGNATYTWSPGSSNDAVITVTPALPGTQTQVVVNYNVSGTDLNSNCPLNPAVIGVTVNAVPVITVNSRSICTGAKATIAPTVTPAGPVTYTIMTASTTTTSTGAFVVGPNTTTQYSITATNQLGCVSPSAAISTITVDQCLGIDEVIANGEIRMYPNPASGGLTKISGLQGRNAVTVFNTLGQAVISTMTEEVNVDIDLSKNASGNYLVKIVNSNNEVQTLKLINNN